MAAAARPQGLVMAARADRCSVTATRAFRRSTTPNIATEIERSNRNHTIGRVQSRSRCCRAVTRRLAQDAWPRGRPRPQEAVWVRDIGRPAKFVNFQLILQTLIKPTIDLECLPAHSGPGVSGQRFFWTRSPQCRGNHRVLGMCHTGISMPRGDMLTGAVATLSKPGAENLVSHFCTIFHEGFQHQAARGGGPAFRAGRP